MKAEAKPSGNEITLISETEEEGNLLRRVTYFGGVLYRDDITDGVNRAVTLVTPKRILEAEPLPTSILSGVHRELSHIPSQHQAAKVASYYRELLAHHVSPEFAEQLTLEYQRMEMENA